MLEDSLDNLGDALTYGLSLHAVRRGPRAKARVALVKAGLILAAGLFVVGQVGYSLMNPGVPVFETMAAVSLIALAHTSSHKVTRGTAINEASRKSFSAVSAVRDRHEPALSRGRSCPP